MCRGGGVLLYVSKYIDFESIDELGYTNKEICDMCTIKFKLKNSNITYLISGRGREPHVVRGFWAMRGFWSMAI